MLKKSLVIILFLVVSCNFSFAQYSRAKITIFTYRNESQYTILFLKNEDTIYKKANLYDFNLDLDSLTPGEYGIEIHSDSSFSEKIFTKKYILTPGDTSYLNINLSLSERKTGPNFKVLDEMEQFDAQFSFGYHENSWTKESNLFTRNTTFRQDYNYYKIRNKIAFVQGGGFEYFKNKLTKDSSLFATLPDTITSEYFYQLTMNFYFKVRFFTGKMNSRTYKPNMFFDFGVGYYFPLFKRHVAEIKNEYKYVEKHIGIPNDVRLMANLGWHPVSVFASYRIFNSFQSIVPEATRFQFGISLTIAETN